MYEEFYGLRERPFSLTPDPEFLYLSTSHIEAIEHLTYGITQKQGFILITGEVGAGKTTICRALLNILGEKISIAIILNPFFSEEELLRYILVDFGATPAGKTKLELMEELNAFLINHSSSGGVSVLIVDEAQNLSLPVMEQIRILSNLETEKEKLLQIVLIGQEELRKRLKLRDLRQLDQRIAVRYHLQLLTGKDIQMYIYHRLTIAGSGGKISFTNAALRGIGRFSRGIPRLINLLCDRALLNGYARQEYRITARMVLQAAKSLRDEEKSISIYPVVMSARLKTGLGAALFIIITITGFFSYAIVKDRFTWHLQHRRIENNVVSPVLNPIQTTREMNSEAAVYAIARDFPYTLHVASFLTMEGTQKKIQQIKQFGLPVFISKRHFQGQGEKIWHHVLIGKFKTREDAYAALEKIREDIPYAYVIEAIPDVEIGKLYEPDS